MPKTLTLDMMKNLIQNSQNIVFFGGAGVSTESGIPDFRSAEGLYRSRYPYPPESILSHSFFLSRPDEFFRFYREKMIFLEASPNPCHFLLARWEREGKLKAVITQNIDNLHRLAGSQKVIELHGSVYRNHCIQCGKTFGINAVLEARGVPKCPCGGIIKPDVVLYEEPLEASLLLEAEEWIRKADILIVGGTSLSVYPAAGLVHFYRGDKMILLTKEKGVFDQNADYVHYGPIGEFFNEIGSQ